MHPAFSVIFLTTLIGAGQGLFLALYSGEWFVHSRSGLPYSGEFYVRGSALSMGLLIAGLFASFFHLGRPERAWRSAAQWKTSWLSREVIVLPIVIVLVALYGTAHYFASTPDIAPPHIRREGTLWIGGATTAAVLALFLCTGMIYACIRFLQEWATPLTVFNYTLLGSASGFTLATALAQQYAAELTRYYGMWAVVVTLVALAMRTASLIRNTRIRRKSSLQTATGVKHQRITQRSQGLMGGSFNTREFFPGASPTRFQQLMWSFLVLVFPVPILLIIAGLFTEMAGFFAAAFLAQYLGLLAERWFFFAQANHPQNLYYQTMG